MGLFDFLQKPNVSEGIGALAQILGAQDRGQVADISPFLQQMDQNRQAQAFKDSLGSDQIAGLFSPQERQFLASLPPQVAQGLIAERMFAKPEATKLETFTGPDGVVYQFDPRTGATKPLTGAKAANPGENVVTVNGQLVDKTTGQVIGDYRDPQKVDPWEGKKVIGDKVVSIGADGNPVVEGDFGGSGKGEFRTMPNGDLVQIDPETGAVKVLGNFATPDAATAAIQNYQYYADQEYAAGRTPLSFNEWELQKSRAGAGTNVGSIPAGHRLVTDPVTGDQHFEVIPGSPEERKANEEAAKAQAEDIKRAETAEGMMSVIDGVLSDPALDSATGMWAWTQSVPGTAAYRFGTRVRQLQGQAFLQAFESLKGAGQITEMEGQKASDAIGRLDSAQSANDYRDALLELRNILGAAAARARGLPVQQPSAAPAAQPVAPAAPAPAPAAPAPAIPRVTTKEEMDALPPGTVFIAPDGSTRRKQ